MSRNIVKILTVSFLFFSQFFLTGYSEIPKSRSVEFYYEVIIENIPNGASELKIWIPYVAKTPYQKIDSFSLSAPGRVLLTYDKTYHNKIIYCSIKSPKGKIKIRANYKIRRYECYGNSKKNKDSNLSNPEDLNKYLISNRLMIVSPGIRDMATNIVKGKNTTLEKARAIYDYVFENVSYDKSIPGWGSGDTMRVCVIRSGNCSDFHSLFVSLLRASDIPAKFAMGFPVPQKENGQIESYHCWAEFYDKKWGWVPVDISEAWKDKSKKEYYFGNIDENRIEFSEGRDIVLEPLANSELLNYFIYPYVEIDGKAYKDVRASFYFKDISKGGEENI